MLTGKNVGRLHGERGDFVEGIKDGILHIEANEIAVRIDLLHLSAKTGDIILRPSGVRRKIGGAKIVDHDESATVPIFRQTFGVPLVQFEASRFAKGGGGTITEPGAITIHA